MEKVYNVVVRIVVKRFCWSGLTILFVGFLLTGLTTFFSATPKVDLSPPLLVTPDKLSNDWNWIIKPEIFDYKERLVAIKKHKSPTQVEIEGKSYEFGPLFDFLSQSENVGKSFSEVDSVAVRNLVNDLVRNGATDGGDFNYGLEVYMKALDRMYWDSLKTKMDIFENLRLNYNLQTFLVDGKNFFDDLKALEPFKENEYAQIVRKYRVDINRLFRQGLTKDEIETELSRLANIEKTRLKEELKKNNKFFALSEDRQNQIVNKFFNDGLAPNTVNTTFMRLANTEKEQLWDVLKNYKIQLSNLLQTHRIKAKILIQGKDYSDQLGKFIIHINKTDNVQLTVASTPIKAMINEWFNERVTGEQLVNVFNNYLGNQLVVYWNKLRKELENYGLLIDKIDQFTINKHNYLNILKKLESVKDSVFANLNLTQQNDLQRLFDRGITIEKFSEQFEQIQRQINIEKNKEKQKTNKKTLTIGLGVGLGVPVVAGGIGLGYWLIRKYR